MQWGDRVRLANAFGSSLVGYWLHGHARPFSASFAVTNRCNIHCSYCNFPSLDPTELACDRIDALLGRLQALGVCRLGLVGGEPLLRKDLGEIVRLAKRRRFYVSVNSNLMLYAKAKERLADVDLVFTSLDGSPQAHRKGRGLRAHDGVIEAIGALVSMGKPVVAICVVSESNLDQYDLLLRQAEQIGFTMHFQPQCVDTEIVRGSSTASQASLHEFWKALLVEKRRGRPIASSERYLEVQSEWLDFSRSAYLDPNERCAAGHGFLFVDPVGNAYPCAFTKGKKAPVNLFDDDWSQAFDGRTPCTRCAVGPYVEFNQLFKHPIRHALAVARSYG